MMPDNKITTKEFITWIHDVTENDNNNHNKQCNINKCNSCICYNLKGNLNKNVLLLHGLSILLR